MDRMSDKICRGSAVGEAHTHGSWGDLPCSDIMRTARGTHITGQTYKLDNTVPNGKRHPRSNHVSDTFRSQEWFCHDRSDRGGSDTPSGIVQLSPRFWRDAKAQSPAPSPRGQTFRSKSQKTFKSEGNDAEQRLRESALPGPTRSKSMGMLNLRLDDVDVCTTDRSPREGMRSPRAGMGSPRGAKSPREGWHSPRSNSDLFSYAEERERAQAQAEMNGDVERRRSASPTYFTSENWMGYSTAKDNRDESLGQFMPSRQFSSKKTRAYSGFVQHESEAQPWSPRDESETATETVAPIANIVDGRSSKGKKVHISKESEGAKRRLMLDATQADNALTQKKHDFPQSPQSIKQLEEFKLSPRLLPPTAAVQNGEPTPKAVIDVQHRTSAEMASSIMPEQNDQGANAQQRKYMVGREVISWANCGRRGATECFQNTRRVAAQISQEAGGRPEPPPYSMYMRDHRNSDVLREHLKAPPIKWQEKLPIPPQGMPLRQTQSVRFSPRLGERKDIVEGHPSQQAVGVPSRKPIQSNPSTTYAYGDVSALPSSMSKETAYLQSGLKMHVNTARTPGYFSQLDEERLRSRTIMSYADKAIPVPHPIQTNGLHAYPC